MTRPKTQAVSWRLRGAGPEAFFGPLFGRRVVEFGQADRAHQDPQDRRQPEDADDPDGTAVLNADDPQVAAMADRTVARVVRFGQGPAAEVRAGVELPSYRGDAVNGLEFTAAARTPDPRRLLDAYHCSSATLNVCRALAGGGYADLRQVHAWNQDFVAGSPAGQRYERLAEEIDRAIAFMHACGADPEQFRAVEFYSSHEALLLDYEQALTRADARGGQAYASSAHLLWIGERTRDPGGAHVEFARQIRNPVAVKIGPCKAAQTGNSGKWLNG